MSIVKDCLKFECRLNISPLFKTVCFLCITVGYPYPLLKAEVRKTKYIQ